MDGVAASSSSYKPPNSLRHAQSLDNLAWTTSPRKKYWGPLDKNSRHKSSWADLVNEEDGVGQDPTGSSDSLNQSADFGQIQSNGHPDEMNSASVRPFNNNPSLPSTQRDIVGNNLHFKTSSAARSDWLEDENDQLAALLLYRDTLKKNLTTAAKAGGGLPRMRHGRVGSQWRHIKQTNTYSGSNLMFIDGTVRIDDSFKYPIPRFGYPPMKRPQHPFSTSFNDLSYSSSNPATQSLDATSWSNNDASHNGNRSFDENQYHEVKLPTQDRNKHF